MAAAKKPDDGRHLTAREKDQMSHLRARIAGLGTPLRAFLAAKYKVNETIAVARARAVIAAHNEKENTARVLANNEQTRIINEITTAVLFQDGLSALKTIELWEAKVRKC